MMGDKSVQMWETKASVKRLSVHSTGKQTIIGIEGHVLSNYRINAPMQYKVSTILKPSGSLVVDEFIQGKPILISLILVPPYPSCVPI